MKSFLTFLLFLCAFSFTLQAQKITLDPPHIVEEFQDADLNDEDLDLEVHIAVTNNTSDTIDLVWTRIVKENCPLEWDTQICDNFLCYYYTVNSNNNPFKIASEETFDNFILHVLPRSVPGCCRVKVDFATRDEPDVVIETAIFDVSVNTPDCEFSTSTQEVAEAQLVSVFPNPTTDAFTLSNNDVVSQVDLYNGLGQKLKTFDFQNGKYINVSDLNPGLYSLALINTEGKTLHSLMLDKK